MKRKHVVVIDANVPAIDTMNVAVERSYRVTFIRPDFRMYMETPRVCGILARLDNIIGISSSTSHQDVEWALRIAGAIAPVDAVITQHEICVDVVADCCSKLGLPFTDSTAVAAARDKARARQIIESAGLRSAKWRLVSSPEEAARAAEEIGGSVIVKPRTGYDSLLAYEAHTPEEASLRTRELLEGIEKAPQSMRVQLSKGVLVEELLIGDLVSAELGCRNGEYFRFMISGRPRSIENQAIEMGATMPADISDEMRTKCFEYAEAVAASLGLDLGIFHIEMIITREGPALVEVNPRLMGGVMPGLYKNLTGDDIQEHLLNLHLGMPLHFAGASQTGFITSRKLMPKQDGRLAREIDLSWVAEAPQLIHFEPYRVQPEEAVKRLSILARYQVKAPSLHEANQAADALLNRFEKEVGVELVR